MILLLLFTQPQKIKFPISFIAVYFYLFILVYILFFCVKMSQYNFCFIGKYRLRIFDDVQEYNFTLFPILCNFSRK